MEAICAEIEKPEVAQGHGPLDNDFNICERKRL